LRVAVSKNFTAFAAESVVVFVTSMTASAPCIRSSSPAPVSTSAPDDRDSTTTS